MKRPEKKQRSIRFAVNKSSEELASGLANAGIECLMRAENPRDGDNPIAFVNAARRRFAAAVELLK